jgi:hypothetical protein
MPRQGDSLRDAAAIESTGAAKACSWVPQNDTRQGSAIANVTWITQGEIGSYQT